MAEFRRSAFDAATEIIVALAGNVSFRSEDPGKDLAEAFTKIFTATLKAGERMDMPVERL